MSGVSPALDQPIPDPLPGVDPTIYVYLNTPQLTPPPMTVLMAAAPVTPVSAMAAPMESLAGDSLDCINSEWLAALRMERDLSVRRKQLSDMQTRLSTLNRDLSHDEKLFADNLDKSAWQDARRWLREVSARVSRYIKDHDIGEATSAAKRTWLEQTYEQYIVPRQYFEGIEQSQREFEAYRKLMQTLLNNMNTAYATASQEGERRAQTILSRISAKVRSSQSRR